MNKRAARALGGFLLVMLIFTFLSWKLDALRTPWVCCVSVRGGSIDGTSYDAVIPIEAVYTSGTSKYIYTLETGGYSWFYPVIVRRREVIVQAENAEKAALQGKYPATQIVQFADRPLSGGTVSVQVWDGSLSGSGDGWVELLGGSPQAGATLRQAGKGWSVSWEDDRLVVRGADRFTAQEALTLLRLDYPGARALDYSWSPAVLRLSSRIWMGAAAVAAVIVLCRLAWLCGKREATLFRIALKTRYWQDYINEVSVRLLAEAVALAVGIFLTAMLIRWLWNVPITVPGSFLPEGSIVEWEHYRQWISSTFPPGQLSENAVELAGQLRKEYRLAGAECAAIAVGCAVWMKLFPKRRKTCLGQISTPPLLRPEKRGIERIGQHGNEVSQE